MTADQDRDTGKRLRITGSDPVLATVGHSLGRYRSQLLAFCYLVGLEFSPVSVSIRSFPIRAVSSVGRAAGF